MLVWDCIFLSFFPAVSPLYSWTNSSIVLLCRYTLGSSTIVILYQLDLYILSPQSVSSNYYSLVYQLLLSHWKAWKVLFLPIAFVETSHDSISKNTFDIPPCTYMHLVVDYFRTMLNTYARILTCAGRYILSIEFIDWGNHLGHQSSYQE